MGDHLRSDNAPEDDQSGLHGGSDSFDSCSEYLDPRVADPVQDQQTSNTAPRDDQRGASPDYNNPPDDSAYLETFDSGSRDVGYVFPSDYILIVYDHSI